MMNRYHDMEKTIKTYIKNEEDLRKKANYVVYVLDWNANDLPDCPTEILKVFYVEAIDEAFLDVAFAYNYWGYPICICDMDVCNPNSFVMHDVLSASTVKNFEKARKEYEEQQKKSLDEQLKAEQKDGAKEKGRKISVVIIR